MTLRVRAAGAAGLERPGQASVEAAPSASCLHAHTRPAASPCPLGTLAKAWGQEGGGTGLSTFLTAGSEPRTLRFRHGGNVLMKSMLAGQCPLLRARVCCSRTSAPWASREEREEDWLVFFKKTCACVRCCLPDTCQAPCSVLAVWWTLPTTQSEILLRHADFLRRKPEVQKLESGHQAAQVKGVHL